MSESAVHTFYHWTTKGALESIRKQGLIPSRGQHCRDIRDRSTAIFLCKSGDVDFWRGCFYDAEVLITLSIGNKFAHENIKWRMSYNAPSKREYACFVAIPADFISEIKIVDREDFEGDHRKYNLKNGIAM